VTSAYAASVQDDVGAFESFSAADAEGKAPPPKKEEPKDKPEAKAPPKQEAAPKADKQESQQPAPSKPSGRLHIPTLRCLHLALAVLSFPACCACMIRLL
jgi:hypothetical protein